MSAEVPPREAEERFGIRTYHNQMPNGEYRFRLLCGQDKTAYIRTQAAEGGAWQQAHFHERVTETYIVQSGWMGACELTNGFYCYRIFRENEIFTTNIGVVHNIYLPSGAIIHTIKHGPPGDTEDRISGTVETDAMTSETQKLNETDLFLHAIKYTKNRGEIGNYVPSSKYNENYRHFDNLIWQVPNWAVTTAAIAFAGSVGASSLFEGGSDGKITDTLMGLTLPAINGIIFLLAGLYCFLLSFVLYRFRWHQKDENPTRTNVKYFKAQALVHFLINIGALFLFSFSMRFIFSISWDLTSKITLSYFIMSLLLSALMQIIIERAIDKRRKDLIPS